MRAWVDHLARTLAEQGELRETVLIGTDGPVAWREVPGAQELLTELCEVYWEGLTRPLPFFPRSALAFAQAVHSKSKNPINKAKAVWNGGFNIEGEKEDPTLTKFFDKEDALGEEFQELALRIFGPILQYEVEPQ